MKLIFVVNMKGGCGKSTIATNLACAMSRSGMRTVLADMDRQRSATRWLEMRPKSAQALQGLDWTKRLDPPPKRTDRLVIDCPAGMRGSALSEIATLADVIVAPLLSSVFDEDATVRFLKRLDREKRVRNGDAATLFVANRYRHGSRAAQRLEGFVADAGWSLTARISERAVYADLAMRGLSLFDLNTQAVAHLQAEWMPLIRAADGV